MEYRISMTALENRTDNICAVGILSTGGIRIKNITLVKGPDGNLFVSMPNRNTGKSDRNGKAIYEEICHPITKEMRQSITEAAKESYETGKPVIFHDDKEGSLEVQAEVFESPYYNRIGRAQLVLNEQFVIKNVMINRKENGDMYVTLPNYKMKSKGPDGKDQYSEIAVMPHDFKREVTKAVLHEYELACEKKEKNRISIKSRLEGAQLQSKAQEKKEIAKEPTQKVI